MKTLIKSVLVCMVAFAAVTVSAQPPQGQRQRMTTEERTKASTERLTKELGLNEAQGKQVYDLQIKMGKEMEEAMKKMRESGERPDRETMMASMEKRRKEMSDGMKKILTEEQFAKWEKQQQERRENMRNRGQGTERGQERQ